MAEFKKLSDVEKVESVKDSTTVLIEENGVIKRMPKDKVGGIKVTSPVEVGQTLVVKAVDDKGAPTEWECINSKIIFIVHDILNNTLNAPTNIYELLYNHSLNNDFILPIIQIRDEYGLEFSGYIEYIGYVESENRCQINAGSYMYHFYEDSSYEILERG